MSEYTAYHGTNSVNVTPIKKSGFKPSISHNEWLGDGIYFFVEGSFNPVDNAREWAVNSAWDNHLKTDVYTNYSILRVSVNGHRVFDLRINDDLSMFEKLRSHIIKRYNNEKDIFKRDLPSFDTYLCNAVTNSLKKPSII